MRASHRELIATVKMVNKQPVSLLTEIPYNRPFHCFQTVSDFTGILRDRKTFFLMYYGRYSICDSGASEPSNKRIGRNLKSSPTYPIVKMGARRENGALPNIPICHWPSQTIGDVYDVQFSLVRKLWDGRETVKSPTIEKFPGAYENQPENQIDRLYAKTKIYRNNERLR